MMRALQHANFTFAKKISHTADSQDQPGNNVQVGSNGRATSKAQP